MKKQTLYWILNGVQLAHLVRFICFEKDVKKQGVMEVRILGVNRKKASKTGNC